MPSLSDTSRADDSSSASDSGAGYWLYSMGDRRLLAGPDDQRWARLAGAARFHPFSMRRRVVRAALRTVIRLRADRLMAARMPGDFELAPGVSIREWWEEASRRLDLAEAAPALLWPPQPDRGRTYVHLLLPGGGSAGFAKVSHTAPNDEELEREAAMLQQLAERALRTARTPRVLAQFRIGGHLTVVQEPFPAESDPSPMAWTAWHDEFLDEFGGPIEMLRRGEIENLPWWGAAERAASDYNAFAATLAGLGREKPLAFRRVHGDFSPANVLRSGGSRWVVDWESAVELGPSLADPMWFHMNLMQRAVQASPGDSLESLLNRFSTWGAHGGVEEAASALAFLLGAGYTKRAGALARVWPKGS